MFEEIIARIAATLQKHTIPYMIIGGQAVLLYGEPRLTRDIDITLGMDTDNLSEVLGIVKELSLKPIPEDIESFVRQTWVLPSLDENTGIRVDFIFSYTPYEAEAIKRARNIVIKGQTVSFAAQEDLIIHKIFAGRPRDIEDVRSILLKNPDVDSEYICRWLKEFDASSSDKKDFLETFEELIRSLKKGVW